MPNRKWLMRWIEGGVEHDEGYSSYKLKYEGRGFYETNEQARHTGRKQNDKQHYYE
jgi:hypothetical protein